MKTAASISIFILHFFVFLFTSTTSAFGQALPVTVTESNPHRGIYVDNFFYINPESWNIGPDFDSDDFFPAQSILGTDQNHDGIFEKEDEFLQYCMDNHITYIVLLDMHRIIGHGIKLWDENKGHEVDIEYHLCRFMNKARNEYCIDQIAAAVDNDGAAQVFIDHYYHSPIPNPPQIISSSMKNHPDFQPVLLAMEDSTLTPADSAFLGSELLKSIYRIINLGECEECESYFNYIFMEYEFWHNEPDDYVDADHRFYINTSCVDFCCNNRFSNDNCVTDCDTAYPGWREARYAGHFVPVMEAIRFLVNAYNDTNNYDTTDIRYMRVDVYTDPNPQFANDTVGLNKYLYAAFLDGIQDSFPFHPSNCPTGTPFPRIADRISMYNFIHYDGTNLPLIDLLAFSNLHDDLNDYNFLPGNPWSMNMGHSNEHTDLHPLMNAEKISENGFDDYWGPWFAESKRNNIFQAERWFYHRYFIWQCKHESTQTPCSIDWYQYGRENSIQRGGALWFAQSHMVQELSKPKTFYAKVSACYPAQPDTVDVIFEYNGPIEAELNIDFRITNNGSNVWPVNGWYSIQTHDFWKHYNPAAPDITASLPVSAFNDTLLAEMIIHYPGGCSYTYKEDILISTQPTIIPWGPTEFCEGESVTLHANAEDTTVHWYLNGDAISTAMGGKRLDLSATKSGYYSCFIDGCGMSDSILVTVHPNPFVDIINFCSYEDSATLFAGPILNTGVTTTGPGGVTYLWSTGEITDRINVNIDGRYTVIVSLPGGCTRTASEYVKIQSDTDSISMSNLISTSACVDTGSVFIHGGESPNHVSITDGFNTYYYPWRSGSSHQFTNLAAGIYTVYVARGGKGCSDSLSFQIGQDSVDFNVSWTKQNVSCYGGNDGSITVTGIGSNAGAVYEIQIPAIGFTQSNVDTSSYPILIPGLAAGSYFIKITDENCDWQILKVAVDSAVPIILDIDTVLSASPCNSSGNGFALVSVESGGAGPFQYQWNDLNNTQNDTLENVTHGSYKVIVTDANGCVSSAVAQVPAPPALLLKRHHPFDTVATCDCEAELHYCIFGGTGNLTVSGSSWDISGNVASMTGLCQGTYTITVTDANGCSITENVTVSSFSVSAQLLSGGTCIGTASAEAIPLSGAPPYSYSWNTIPVQTTAIATNLPNGTFTVTVVDDCQDTAYSSIVITATDTCCGIAGNTLPQQPTTTNTSDSTDYDVNPSGGIIEIGTGVNLTLTSVHFYIMQGVEIIVRPGAQLTLNHCILEACDKMWKGITVDSGGTLITNHTLIQDAQYAVMPLHGSVFTASYTIFDKNFAGIYTPVHAGYSNALVSIYYCEFLCTGNLKSGYTGQTPEPMTHTFAGIYANNLGMLHVSQADNRFENLNFGVFSSNSNVFVSAFTNNLPNFYNIRRHDNYILDANASRAHNWMLGAAIYARGNGAQLLRVKGNSSPADYLTSHSQFDQCDFGVIGDNINSDINLVKMTDCNTGIKILNTHELKTRVHSNAIFANKVGVDLLNNRWSYKLEISDNKIFTNQSTDYIAGIRAHDFGIANYNAAISNNQIYYGGTTGNAGSFGIDLTGTNGYLVKGNLIISDRPFQAMSAGISLSGCRFSRLQCNEVIGGSNTLNHGNNYAVKSLLSPDYFYKCNIIRNTFEGFHFEGFNASSFSNWSLLESNDIFEHIISLHVDSGGRMGRQNHKGNLWLGNTSSQFALHEDSLGAFLDEYIYYTGLISHRPATVNPATGWFNFNTLSNDDSCFNLSTATSFCSSNELPLSKQINMSDLVDIAQSNFHTSDYDDENSYTMNRSLMQELLLQPVYINEHNDIESFFDNYSDANIGILGSVRLAIDSFYVTETDWNDIGNLGDHYTSISQYSASYASNDSLLLFDSTLTTEERSELILDILETAEQLAAVSIDISEIYEDVQDILYDRISGIMSLLGSTTGENIMEENEMTTDTIYLSKLALGIIPDSADSTALFEIASQCPLKGGPSVLRARSLYQYIDPDIHFDDDRKCASPDTCLVPERPEVFEYSNELNNMGLCGASVQVATSSSVNQYIWNIPDDNQINVVYNNDDNTIELEFGNEFSKAELCVKAVNSCGLSPERCVMVYGRPSPVLPENIIGSFNLCPWVPSEPEGPAEPLYDYLWEPIPGATSYTIISPSGDVAVIVTDMPTNSPVVSIDWNDSLNTDSIAVFATNDCGNSDTTYFKMICENLRVRSKTIKREMGTMIKVFPNPTMGSVKVYYRLNTDSGLLLLRNSLGQILQTNKLESTSNLKEFFVSHLPSGLIEWMLFDGETLSAKGLLSIMK